MGKIELFQFPASHFNEKARWTLDLKGVAHERISLLPGPHAPRMTKLTGKSQTPALRDAGEVIAGSAQIIDHLERKFPEPRLYPEDPDERRRALELQREFDDEVGPAVRLAKFFEVMDGEYAAKTFCQEKGVLTRALYRASFPVVQTVMKKKMAINAANAETARERTRSAFDFVAKEAGESGYLVGSAFSVADLCCAALLMPAVSVSEWGGPVDADTERVSRWLERWANHPGAEWVREIFRRHRRPR